MVNTQVTESQESLLSHIHAHRMACEQFSINSSSNIQAGILQRDQRITELEALATGQLDTISGLQVQVTTAQGERDAALAQVASLQQRIDELNADRDAALASVAALQQQIAELNAAIDAAQGQS